MDFLSASLADFYRNNNAAGKHVRSVCMCV